MTGASPSSGGLIGLQIGHHQSTPGSAAAVMTESHPKAHARWDRCAQEIVN